MKPFTTYALYLYLHPRWDQRAEKFFGSLSCCAYPFTLITTCYLTVRRAGAPSLWAMLMRRSIPRLKLRTWKVGFLTHLDIKVTFIPKYVNPCSVVSLWPGHLTESSLVLSWFLSSLGGSTGWLHFLQAVARDPTGTQCCRLNPEHQGLRASLWLQVESAALVWPSWLSANRRKIEGKRALERPERQVELSDLVKVADLGVQ